MFGEFTIHAGDFETSRKAQFTSNIFIMPTGVMFGSEKYPSSQVEEVTTASEESVKRIGGTVGWGVAGAALLGPVGLLAGLLAGGRKKEVTFIVKFTDGKKALCTADNKTYTKIQSSRF